VIIGHNNAGKTNLIKALSLVIDTQKSKRLEVDDFNKNLTLAELKAAPPKISIAITIKKGNEEEPCMSSKESVLFLKECFRFSNIKLSI
jgi:predicted ATP-dependent endonuclease of OLD family